MNEFWDDLEIRLQLMNLRWWIEYGGEEEKASE